MTLTLTDYEVVVLIDALDLAASRYESLARYRASGPKAPRHLNTALILRTIRSRLNMPPAKDIQWGE